MRKILTLLLFFSASVFSSPAYEKNPLAVVEGCVNALTGDLVFSENDLPQFPYQRVFVSSEGRWKFSPHTHLVLYGEKVNDNGQEKKKKKKKEKEKFTYSRVVVCEPNGCPISYSLDEEGQYTMELPAGVTNTAKEKISARNNLNNQHLVRSDTFTFVLKTPEGVQRVYKKNYSIDHDLYFLLAHEEHPNGNIYSYEYDQSHRVYLIRSGELSCRVIHGENGDFDLETSSGRKISYRFSMQKNTPQLKRVSSETREEHFDYTNSRISKWQPVEGKTLLFEYTQEGKIESIKNQKGDLLHRFQYRTNQTEVIHGDESKTTYTYSPTLYLQTISTEKNLVETKWDDEGKLLSQVEKNKAGEILFSVRYDYDLKGNPVSEIRKEETLQREFDPLNRITKEISQRQLVEYEYLHQTDLITAKMTTENGSISRTFYEYGSRGELKKVTIDDGPKYSYRRVIEIEGGTDRPTSVIEKADTTLLKKTVYQYSPEGIVEEIYDRDGTLCLKRTTTMSAVHRPWKEMIPIGTSKENGYEIKRDYFGRITAKRLHDPQGMLLEEETWTYNALFLLSSKDKMGLMTDYSYNREGRKVREVLHKAKGDIEKRFSYDALGRLEKEQVGEVITQFFYDENDRIIEKREMDLDENLLQKIAYHHESNPIEITHYTSHGQTRYPLIAKTTPKFEEYPGIHYTYDVKGRLTELVSEDKSIHYSFQYNKRDQVILMVDHANNVSGRRSYDDVGNFLEETLLNGLTLKNSYDLYGRKNHCLLPDGSEIFYKWGPKFLEEIHRISDKGKYEYKHRFLTYDLSGFPIKQRLSEGFGELTFEIDNTLCVCAISSRHFEQRIEDLEPIEFEQPAKPYTYTCDALGRPILFKQANREIYYTYDAWNRRMSKRVREYIKDEWVETLYIFFLYDGNHEIGTVDVKEGWVKHLRVLSPHPINPGDQAIAYELEGMPYVPLHDLYGNVKKLLSVIRRKVMETYLFSFSGREKIADYWGDAIPLSKANNPWRFGSHWTDEETGLIYIDGDYYDPNEKIFLKNRYAFLRRPQLFALPHFTVGEGSPTCRRD